MMPSTAAALLADLRSKGWAVAVHNDYRLNDHQHTFWLLTHRNGRWIKGEGASDHDALIACYEQAKEIMLPTAPPHMTHLRQTTITLYFHEACEAQNFGIWLGNQIIHAALDQGSPK